jgi:uncharacterized repeat protein (TIGR02543 family)
MNRNVVTLISAVCLVLLTLPQLLTAEQGYSHKDYYFVEPGPVQQSTLYTDGSVIELHTEIVTWPMINSDMTHVTPEEFKKMMIEGRRAFEANPHTITVGGKNTGRGLNVIYNVTSPPPGALEAFDSVSAYLGRTFSDDVTVTINVQFVPMAPGIIGGTSSNYAGAVTWANTRTGLQNDMDSDDTIHVWLPSGGTIPVRYVYGSGTITDENYCYFTKSSYKAAIGDVSGADAFMQFNTNFTFDWDPSNGISGGTICFQSVAIHETGHCLGFTSAADFRPNDIEALDIFRFQNTDDGGDYNPDNYSEFQTTARMVDKDDGGATNDDVISDIITAEYRMSDGTPYQCSHFKQGTVYAIMQPAFSYGQTYYPNFLRTPDLDMFDAIGWDYPPEVAEYTLSVYVEGSGYVTKDPNQMYYSYGQEVELTAHAFPGWYFDEWTDDLTGSVNPDTIIMDDDKTVTAHFLEGTPVYENDRVNSHASFLDVSPNPFSDKATISYDVGQSIGVIELAIYDAHGQLVKQFNNVSNRPVNQIIWDGTNELGNSVANGVYFLKLSTGVYRTTKKLLLLK